MVTASEIREARGIVAELAAANPLLLPVFERLEREYQQASLRVDSPLIVAARRAADERVLI